MVIVARIASRVMSRGSCSGDGAEEPAVAVVVVVAALKDWMTECSWAE
jgi:hypothetical protein